MQKVEGSSPFIRSSEAAGNGGFSCCHCGGSRAQQLFLQIDGALRAQKDVCGKRLEKLGDVDAAAELPADPGESALPL